MSVMNAMYERLVLAKVKWSCWSFNSPHTMEFPAYKGPLVFVFFLQSHPLPQFQPELGPVPRLPASNPKPSGFESEPSDFDTNMMVE